MIELNDDNEKSIWPKVIGILITIIVISPLMTSVLSVWAKPLTFIEFDSSVWIGFWGSYLGGIIGTVGVIYVAHLQNREQARLNDKIESNNKERLKSEIKMELYKEYIKNVHNIHFKSKKLSDLSLQLILNTKKLKEFNGGLKIWEDLIEEHEILINEIKDFNNDYFLIIFDEVLFSNQVLRENESALQKPLNDKYLEDIDDLLDILNSKNMIQKMQFKFEDEYIDKENYIQKMIDLHSSFEKLYEWTLTEIAYANIDVGNILRKLNSKN